MSEEVRLLKEAVASESSRSQRLKTDLSRRGSECEELQCQVRRLTMRVEVAEKAAKSSASELELASRSAEERMAQRLEEARRAGEVEVEEACREAKLAEKMAGERAAKAEGEVERLSEELVRREAKYEEEMGGERERTMASSKRVEQLTVEKNSLGRETANLRSEAASYREKVRFEGWCDGERRK